MHRQKGTRNTPQCVIGEIVRKHKDGYTVTNLAKEYGKTYETIKSMIKRENKKSRHEKAGVKLKKQQGRKPAVTLQEYKYENKRLKMENDLLRDFLQVAGKR